MPHDLTFQDERLSPSHPRLSSSSRALVAAVLLLGAAFPACYSPTIQDGAFRCDKDGKCPDGFHCASEGSAKVCRKDGVTFDAGADVSVDLPGADVAIDGPQAETAPDSANDLAADSAEDLQGDATGSETAIDSGSDLHGDTTGSETAIDSGSDLHGDTTGSETAPDSGADLVSDATGSETAPDSGADAVLIFDTLSPDTLSPDTLSPDTLSPDTLSPDTLSPDTLSPDTLSPDTLSPDTLSPDTLSPDTLSPDTLSPDTLSPDTLSPDTLSPDTLSPDTQPPLLYACPATVALTSRVGDPAKPSQIALGVDDRGIPHLFIVGDKLYHLWRNGNASFALSPVTTGGSDVVATTVAADASRLENRLHVLYGVGNDIAPCQGGTGAFHHAFANMTGPPLSWTASNALGTSTTRPFFGAKSTDLTIAGDNIYGAFEGQYQYIVSGVPPTCNTPTILTRMQIKPDGSGNGYTYGVSNYYSQGTYARTRVTVGPSLAAHSAIFFSNNFLTDRVTAATNANFGQYGTMASSQSAQVTPAIAMDSQDSLHYAFVDDATQDLYWASWAKSAGAPPASPSLVSNIPPGCSGHIARAPVDIVIDDTDRPHIVYVCTAGTHAGTWIARRDASPTPTWVHTKVGSAKASHVRMRFHRGRLHLIESFPTTGTNAAYRCLPVP